ncbi:protein kinase domain-containing protein [Candidatus Uabimicrobium amorphum]|uniref:non-specific serine/threonine protein kinase n=1 Tax=Uabimicrobium amorphum TaxID=2596890 RepID=A0A5S9F3V4_UABAM|nr:protein kinase [Candidatus Uabimicrobium amorphum]BBM85145.1 serine/threonine-protein kinase PknB [Candidatus Uabimicrobium amorphum]
MKFSQNDAAFNSQANFDDTLQHSFPNYKIIRELGRGGMGIVLLAQHRRLQNFVAIKVLLGVSSKRFSREGQALAKLNHPGIVRIYEMSPNGSYFIMEYVEGVTLRDLFHEGQLSRKEAIKIFMQICQAIHHVHENGIIHRDLKPENIMIQRETNQVKIMDFGIVKLNSNQQTALSAAGSIIGTISYMPPEQIECSRNAGKQSDIYAIGIMIYEFLTGKPPFHEGGHVQIAYEIIHSPTPPIVGKSPALTKICMKCIEKDTNKRYQTCNSLYKALQGLLVRKPIGKPVQKEKKPYILYLSVFLLMGICIVIAGVFSSSTASTKKNSLSNKHTTNNKDKKNGKLVLPDGVVYKGQRKNNKPHGKGKMLYKNGDCYTGNFVNGKFHGQGEMIYKNQRKYIGEFANGEYQGTGRFTYKDGSQYIGEFVKNKKHGTGLYIDPKGEAILDGMWRNDKCIQTKRRPSAPSKTQSYFRIVNNTPFKLKLFWVDYGNKLRAYSDILPGKAFVQHSYIGHSWEAYAEGKPIATFTIGNEQQLWEIQHNDLYRHWLENKE